MKHPRDTYLTVYGRKPVLEVLQEQDLPVDKIWLAIGAKGDVIRDMERICEQRQIPVNRVTAEQVARMSKNPKQDQGVAADIVIPNMMSADDFFADAPTKAQLIAIDGVTTPANIGLIIRTATALGIDGILIPRKGTSSLNPLVIKASAGVIFKSTLLKCEQLHTVLPAATKAGFKIYGLTGENGSDIFKTDFAARSIFVLGNETEGISPQVRQLLNQQLAIPMYNGVESLNVACAGAVLLGELAKYKPRQGSET